MSLRGASVPNAVCCYAPRPLPLPTKSGSTSAAADHTHDRSGAHAGRPPVALGRRPPGLPPAPMSHEWGQTPTIGLAPWARPRLACARGGPVECYPGSPTALLARLRAHRPGKPALHWRTAAVARRVSVVATSTTSGLDQITTPMPSPTYSYTHTPIHSLTHPCIHMQHIHGSCRSQQKITWNDQENLLMATQLHSCRLHSRRCKPQPQLLNHAEGASGGAKHSWLDYGTPFAKNTLCLAYWRRCTKSWLCSPGFSSYSVTTLR